MTADVLAALIEGAIPILGGLYCMLLGARVLGRKPGQSPAYDLWYEKHGGQMRKLGALVMVGGFVFLGVGLGRALPPSENWVRYKSDDGVCSAEFPQPPKSEKKSIAGVEMHALALSLAAGEDAQFMMASWELPADQQDMTNEDWFNQLGKNYPAMYPELNIKLVRETADKSQGLPGREFEFDVNDTRTLQAKVFLNGTTAYLITAITPAANREDDRTRRFLKSFRFEAAPALPDGLPLPPGGGVGH